MHWLRIKLIRKKSPIFLAMCVCLCGRNFNHHHLPFHSFSSFSSIVKISQRWKSSSSSSSSEEEEEEAAGERWLGVHAPVSFSTFHHLIRIRLPSARLSNRKIRANRAFDRSNIYGWFFSPLSSSPLTLIEQVDDPLGGGVGDWNGMALFDCMCGAPHPPTFEYPSRAISAWKHGFWYIRPLFGFCVRLVTRERERYASGIRIVRLDLPFGPTEKKKNKEEKQGKSDVLLECLFECNKIHIVNNIKWTPGRSVH